MYGIPDELYLYPESRGYVPCGKNITDAEVNISCITEMYKLRQEISTKGLMKIY